MTFDRVVALSTMVLAAVAAWAAWRPYRWAGDDRRKRTDAERRLAELLARLAPTPIDQWHRIEPADEDAVAIAVAREILVRMVDAQGRTVVRRRLRPSG